jgi:hypothetical protein
MSKFDEPARTPPRRLRSEASGMLASFSNAAPGANRGGFAFAVLPPHARGSVQRDAPGGNSATSPVVRSFRSPLSRGAFAVCWH